MSIGAVSRAVGVPIGTLRNWERRYGVPSPDRTDGGHRLYGQDTVDFLELVNVAMRHGHRPAQLLRLSTDELTGLLSTDPKVVRTNQNWGTEASHPDLFDAIQKYDSDFLFSAFRAEVARSGLGSLVLDRIVPLLEQMSEAWEAGDISIEQEHFASEILRDFLSTEWRALPSSGDAVRVVCTTFPGERHFIGLHMAAALMAVEGVRVLFLGPDIPLKGTQDAAACIGADAVVISCSAFSDCEQNQIMLKTLVKGLSPSTEVWAGGTGVPAGVGGVRRFHDFREFRSFVSAKISSATRD
jgi:MerR family transcriptional regulator, light-induced transcriptional regulator